MRGAIQRHASIDARVRVYHHNEGLLGEVVKRGGFFCPIGIVKALPGTTLPDCVELDPEVLEQVELEGWELLETRMIQLFAKRECPPGEKKKSKWRKAGIWKGRQKWKCVCGHQTIHPNRHVCKNKI